MDSLKKLFPPKGRLSQKNYILYQLLLLALGIIYLMLVFLPIPGLIFLIIPYYIFEIYISAKRLQDCNISGWYSPFIPITYGLGQLFLCFYPGTKGINKFGHDPREEKEVHAKQDSEEVIL